MRNALLPLLLLAAMPAQTESISHGHRARPLRQMPCDRTRWRKPVQGRPAVSDTTPALPRGGARRVAGGRDRDWPSGHAGIPPGAGSDRGIIAYLKSLERQ
jgi:hypothetical protein